DQSFTYDHRIMKIGLPVRSALHKHDTGGLVVKWVTIGESLLLYVFAFCSTFCLLLNLLPFAQPFAFCSTFCPMPPLFLLHRISASQHYYYSDI
ncbi:hypothetical protein K505DRAFT_258676, partial [Melanomma pulvis-pyrius CBS 109.77]